MLLSKQVRERCLPLLRESQSLLPPLEEMEKNITGFYQALEKASHITSTADSEGPTDFKQKCQVTSFIFQHKCGLNTQHFQRNAPKCLTSFLLMNTTGAGNLHTQLQEVPDRDRAKPPDHTKNNEHQ